MLKKILNSTNIVCLSIERNLGILPHSFMQKKREKKLIPFF